MEFTCPHCGKPFEAKLREASRSAKANAARKRNGALGGRRKASDADLTRIFFSRKDDWTQQTFVDAVKKQAGFTYSRTQGFALLKKFRASPEMATTGMPDDIGSDEPATLRTPIVKNNSAKGKAITDVVARNIAFQKEEQARHAVARGKKAVRQR